ncbi:Gfo/Idh/MocA family oxidoreductase [Halobellus ordinarius]|uniref:Gfo/Idh/MocA family oxidoreductase n=1 Tax=Halobellus ordinarius TaxID=3075120 RepID=UPI0028807753|nr:Gfo/Idh/MocA family oxidoreductase [Halobellus sp. ZY16]
MTENSPLHVGVIGVGSMGTHHARVYAELPEVELVGVADADWDRATEIAEKYNTRALNEMALLQAVDAVSIAVPTPYHAEGIRKALTADTHVLVEKPFVDDAAEGRELIALADERDRRLQVGHIERFNPAVETLTDIVAEMDVRAVEARRLGPPIDRENTDSVVRDLMIHDIDILLSLFDADVADASAAAVDGDPYVSATLKLENGVLGTLTASRITHQKVRQLAVTGRECQVTVDYLTQSVEIHRQSLPQYIEHEGDVRYRSESVVERPQVNSGEPLRRELQSFVDAIRSNREPAVSGSDGLRALELIRLIENETEQRPAAVVDS